MKNVGQHYACRSRKTQSGLHEETDKTWRKEGGDRMERTAPSEGGREEMRLKDKGHLSLSSRALPGGHARRASEESVEQIQCQDRRREAVRSASLGNNGKNKKSLLAKAGRARRFFSCEMQQREREISKNGGVHNARICIVQRSVKVVFLSD